MWLSTRTVALVALYSAWCLHEAEAILQVLQLGTAATGISYAVSLSGAGAALGAGALGAGTLGAISALALGRRRRFGRRRGRSIPIAGTQLPRDLAFRLVEALDTTSGCAKKLLCEEALNKVQKSEESSNSPGRENIADTEDSKEGDAALIDELGDMILQFVKSVPWEGRNPPSAGASLFNAVTLGETGHNCSDTYNNCSYSRSDMLSGMIDSWEA